jgi:hypothetical protein
MVNSQPSEHYSMDLVQLIYASTVSDTFDDADLKAILESAKQKNNAESVTGILCFDGKFFMQCLEGGRKQVNSIYANILADERHHSAELLYYSTIDKRGYSQWEMGLVPKEALTHSLTLLYSTSGQYNPYEMAATSAEQFLKAIRAAIPLL